MATSSTQPSWLLLATVLFALCWTLCACTPQAPSAQPPGTHDVTIEPPPAVASCTGPDCAVTVPEVYAHPERYDGRRIRVSGLYCTGFEEGALYGAASAAPETAIWVEVLEIEESDRELFDAQRRSCAPLVLTGGFKKGPSGHLDMYFGELHAVTYLRE